MEMNSFNVILTEMSVAFILLLVTDNLVGLLSVATTLGNMTIQLFDLLNCSVKFEDDLAGLREKLNVKKQNHLPTLQFNKKIIVMQCKIQKESFSLIMQGKLILEAGKHILIQGPSGEGKTTFLNALFGLEDGITLSHGLPGNYFGDVVQMYQSFRENFKVTNLTLRQVFSDSMDDALVYKCLEVANCGRWIKRLTLDTKIGIISGGEKTRLAIASLLYEVIVENKSILILDEPEQGSDPEIAYEMIKNIMEFVPNKMIIIVSHLERIGNANEFKWDNRICVNNGVISIY